MAPDAHDPQGRSSQFKYPGTIPTSSPSQIRKKSLGRGGRTPPAPPPRRRCAAPGLGCAQPKSPKPDGSRPSRAKLKHQTKVQKTGVRGLRFHSPVALAQNHRRWARGSFFARPDDRTRRGPVADPSRWPFGELWTPESKCSRWGGTTAGEVEVNNTR